VEGAGAEQEVGDQVPGVGDRGVGPLEGQHREGHVGGEHDGQAGDQQPEGDRAPAGGGGQPGRQGQQEHVPDRVGQRHQQLDQPERRVLKVGDHHQHPGQQPEPDGDDGRVDHPGGVAPAPAAEGQQGQAGGQHRVAGQVQRVGQGRERLDAQDQLIDREQGVAGDEQALGGRDQPPGGPPGRAVPADPGGDGGHRRGADDHVQDRPGAVGQQVVAAGRQRARAQVEPPDPASHAYCGRRGWAPV
jgi:hypothetical protein